MRQTTLHRNDTIVQLSESYQPRGLQDFLHTTGGRAKIHAAVAELADFGDVDVYVSGRRQDADVYTVQLEIDVSRNREAVRNLGIATIGARVQRFFGYDPLLAPAAGAATGAPVEADDGKDLKQGPPASALGDFYRSIGHAFGLLADYVVAAIVGACVGIKSWFSKPTTP